ncbi:MAG: hypothetical protein JEZ14_17915 [Marinilabiliaceae bacterium]|nr:hypothetical protein [Marinilabiliaceae bacterium]
MIKPILYALLTKEEFYTLTKRILQTIQVSELDEPVKVLLTGRIGAPLQIYEASLNRDNGNPLTKRVEEKDAIRDHRFLGLRAQVEAHTYHWEAPKQEAAKTLMEIIRRHGWGLHNSGYKKQTAQQGALIQELETEPASSHLQNLALEEWFEQMVAAGQDFERILQDREAADSRQVVTLVDSRKALYNDLQATLSYVESQMAFAPTEPLQQLINTINEIITGVTSTAKARHTRRQSEEAVPE